MASHKDLTFTNLHKAKFATGENIAAPITPEGVGDAYWAPDTQTIRLSNLAGDDWLTYDFGSIGSGGSINLDDLADVNAPAPSDLQVLTWINGDSMWEARTVSFASALTDLSDVTITSAAKGNLLAKSSTDWINVAVGANDTFLIADSSATAGVKWGPIPNFDTIISDGNGDVLTDSNGNVLSS